MRTSSEEETRLADVTIYGATGFTGTLACEYLDHVVQLARAQETPKLDVLQFQNDREFLHLTPAHGTSLGKLRWYIAGRDGKKLQKMLEKYKTCSGMFVADCHNNAAVQEMVQNTRVLASFAGPFALYGTPIVEACVAHGTHYCDSTGEVPWVQQMEHKFHERARAKGTKIVPFCGFDCIPSDLGVLYAVQKLREFRRSPEQVSVKSCHTFATLNGGLSGGTTYTFMLMENDPVMRDPFALGGSGPESVEQREHALANLKQAKYDERVGAWTAPFMMEQLNTRVVRKSAHALHYRAPGRGGFLYSESSLAQNEAKAMRMAQPGPSIETRKRLVEEGKLPKPGEGPAHAARRKSRFQLFIRAEAEDDAGNVCWVTVSGGEMGYEDTSLMVVESALAMALNFDSLPPGGGVLTPSVGLGSALIERLQLAGIRFRAYNKRPVHLAAL